ncbi:DUF4864 domain-containing protein [Spiribacter insolitus]|uniref:DUF4864 domain-containing protein n=1 Tax=Spiribacter insolitus TaxID=3122417 RepID=A0ABV3T8J3_9GAMM
MSFHGADSIRHPAGLLLLVCVLTLSVAGAQEGPAADRLLEPSPERSAREVITIQLDALSDNDQPETNAGIEQVWAFAHPRNRVITGPLSRFTRMLRGPGYGMLINHLSYEITEIRRTGRTAVYQVKVLSRDGGFYRFRWRLEKAAQPGGPAWMTTRVTPAEQTGEQLS